MPFGYWEAKDEKDDLDAEIEIKKRRGYPQDNIIFEDSNRAVLVQEKEEVYRCPVDDVRGLEKLLDLFFDYERTEITEFRKAVEQFKTDLPMVLEALRSMIELAHKREPDFRKAAEEFLKHAQEAINPSLTEADVREMLIQHILTEDVFAAVFPGTPFHQDNNVARELYKLEATFFKGDTKYQTLKAMAPYYAAVRSAAAQIATHHEKQTFLKVIYENFYKVYNPKAADRLGVIYTPNEIVRFMIESADYLCEKHFGRNLIDRDVEILDPAAGTGTFVCEMLEHFRGQPAKLKHKYLEELHANEVAILPYYVANLNIEATYAAITGEYLEYPNLCFVDTLDNTYALRKYRGHMDDLFGSLSDDNVRRIRRQNSRKISVIIGNPPYNAWQENFNFRNPNRPYKEIDKRIKETYVESGTAQNQIALYDMYVRFFRWASDRLGENGIVAFVTNRSFLDSHTFDGFRKIIAGNFAETRVIDLGGDIRENPKLSGTKHNVFGIQTGVAISFFIKRAKSKGCHIFYARRPEFESADEKLAWLGGSRLQTVTFEEVKPDSKSNWIEQGDSEFDSLLPLFDQDSKEFKIDRSKTIFWMFSSALTSQRDEWVYGLSSQTLESKMRFFVDAYETARTGSGSERAPQIKWDPDLERHRDRGIKKSYDRRMIVDSLYRPYCRRLLYFDRHFIGRQYQMPALFLDGAAENTVMVLSDRGARSGFNVLATRYIPEAHLCASTDRFQVVSKLIYEGTPPQPRENISDWAYNKFSTQYQTRRERGALTKDAIFHYVYGVLHDPVYRKKYALNLKREFPRIPFYKDFWQWAEWGKELMELHIGYESVTPAKLKRIDMQDEKALKAGLPPKCILKVDKEGGRIIVDSETTLTGIPSEAWDYRLGNRSALEWILDQYKEKKPKDPTVREKFNTYRFTDYKEKVIDLLRRVTTVSVRTVAVVEAMRKAAR